MSCTTALRLLLGLLAMGLAPMPAFAQIESLTKSLGLEESARPVKEIVPGWRVPRKIVVLVENAERARWLQQSIPDVRIVGVQSVAEAEGELRDADAAVQFRCDVATFSDAPNLKWIHASAGGSDGCLQIPAVARGDILLTDSRKVKTLVLSEMAMGYVFALARSIDVAVDNQRRRDLTAGGRPAMQLKGRTMLIVGLGGAGTEIARMAHAMGMHVIATRNSSRRGPPFVEHVGLADELPLLIGGADIVMIAAPLTPRTKALFDKRMFARMKRGAMFVNWSRADIVVPEDLAAALVSGQVGSAALNWATPAPLPQDHPLWRAPNLILAPWGGTGGGAGTSDAREPPEQVEQRWQVVRENIRRFVTGDRMYSLVDPARGY
ncbi:MAG TPA: NAD(P)-dependent oxidoreductase [Steroidobacteraceae bacterium]|nr:NAD(P)-dependent oxidoreductase [Steroidobacteraceae bacterium]